MSTSITGQGISIYPPPDDALSSTSKNPVQNKVIDEEITDVKNAIDAKAPVIINTASGDIATFADGADGGKIRKVVGSIIPQQDLHGQSAPYPAGGGKNKLKTGGLIQGAPSSTLFSNTTPRTFTVGTFVTNLTPNNYYQLNRVTQVSVAENAISVTTDAAAYALALPMTGLTVGAVYVVSAVKTNGVITVSFYKEDGTFISNTVENPTNFTVPAETYYTLIHFNPTGGGTQATYTDIQLELGSSPTSYAPYENICPISGWTGANIEHTGVNIWDEEWELGGINDTTGEPNVSTNSQFRSKNYIPCTQDTDYFAYYNGNSGGGLYVYFYDSDKTFIGRAVRKNSSGNNVANFAFTTPAKTAFLMLKCQPLGTEPVSNNKTASINYPSTDTVYHSYTGTTLPINWQTEAGTIYGGTVTLNEDGSADVVTTWYDQIVTKDTGIGRFPWGDIQTDSATGIEYARALFIRDGGVATEATNVRAAICDKLPIEYGRPSINHGSVYDGDVYGPCIALPTSIIGTTNETLRAYLAENEFKFVWELSTPSNPIHFDNIGQLYTFLGTNNVWIDCGNITECDYPADTKLYIDGLTAPDEDMIANANIASGKYFVVNNQLYLSTAAIAAGASIVPGTNCTATNIAAALNAINT